MPTLDNLKNELFESLSGKKIYFMRENRIAVGNIRSCNRGREIVVEDCSISSDEPFFYTEEELIDFLRLELQQKEEANCKKISAADLSITASRMANNL